MNARTPQKQFSFTFAHPIWQIRPDSEQGILALELRNGDRLQVEFVVLDIITGQVSEPYRAIENWWIGLEDTCERVLFLHGFGNRSVGTHLGIRAIVPGTNQELWRQEPVVFYGVASNSRLIVRSVEAEKEQFVALDWQTGAILAEDILPTEAHTAVTDFAQRRTAASKYPAHHPAGSEYFALLKQFIFLRSGREAVGAIDYLETENYLVLGYYELVAEGKWQNILGIFSATDGSLLLEEVLVASGSKLSQDAFFIMNTTLLFVKEKNTVVGYSV